MERKHQNGINPIQVHTYRYSFSETIASPKALFFSPKEQIIL